MTDVTIILTTHDRPHWLRVALASVPSQCRVIVADDGSKSRIGSLVASGFGAEYVRVAGKFPIGFAAARCAVLPMVNSEFQAFLDDDDELGPDWLDLSLAKMAEGFDVVAAPYWQTDAAMRVEKTVPLLPATLARLQSGHCPVNDGALVRRSVLDGVTWHPERDTVMMYSLWLDLAKRGARFGVVDEPCWFHRMHDGNMSAHLGQRDAEWRRVAIAESAA